MQGHRRFRLFFKCRMKHQWTDTFECERSTPIAHFVPGNLLSYRESIQVPPKNTESILPWFFFQILLWWGRLAEKHKSWFLRLCRLFGAPLRNIHYKENLPMQRNCYIPMTSPKAPIFRSRSDRFHVLFGRSFRKQMPFAAWVEVPSQILWSKSHFRKVIWSVPKICVHYICTHWPRYTARLPASWRFPAPAGHVSFFQCYFSIFEKKPYAII